MKEAASGQLHRQLQKMPDATAALNDRTTTLVEQTSSIDLSGRGTQPTPSTLAAKSDVAWAVFIRRTLDSFTRRARGWAKTWPCFIVIYIFLVASGRLQSTKLPKSPHSRTPSNLKQIKWQPGAPPMHRIFFLRCVGYLRWRGARPCRAWPGSGRPTRWHRCW